MGGSSSLTLDSLAGVPHTKVRNDGSEWIIGNFGPGVRHGGKKGAFACVGYAHEPYVSHLGERVGGWVE